MADINFSARLEAISELAKIADADFTAENGEITRWTKGDKPTEEEIQTKLDSTAYARNRQVGYSTWQDQLDTLFHDMTAGKGTKDGEWYKAVAKVKSDNPKP
jgi:hypothetical protein